MAHLLKPKHNHPAETEDCDSSERWDVVALSSRSVFFFCYWHKPLPHVVDSVDTWVMEDNVGLLHYLHSDFIPVRNCVLWEIPGKFNKDKEFLDCICAITWLLTQHDIWYDHLIKTHTVLCRHVVLVSLWNNQLEFNVLFRDMMNCMETTVERCWINTAAAVASCSRGRCQRQSDLCLFQLLHERRSVFVIVRLSGA